MNKKLLIIIALAVPLAQAAPHKNWVARWTCDLLGLIPATYTTGTEDVEYGVLETDAAKIQNKEFIKVGDKNFAIEKVENGNAVTIKKADDTTPAELRAIHTVHKTEAQDRQNIIDANAKEYHTAWGEKAFRFKTWRPVERLYFAGFWALTSYGCIKIAQKLFERFDDDQKTINFDQFEDDVEDTINKIKAATNAQS